VIPPAPTTNKWDVQRERDWKMDEETMNDRIIDRYKVGEGSGKYRKEKKINRIIPWYFLANSSSPTSKNDFAEKNPQLSKLIPDNSTKQGFFTYKKQISTLQAIWLRAFHTFE
jgi:hypothetical protein